MQPLALDQLAGGIDVARRSDQAVWHSDALK
jgi:hypothetical protein